MRIYKISRTHAAYDQYDCMYGHVIVHDSEEGVRLVASLLAGDEGHELWADPKLSVVEDLGQYEGDVLESHTVLSDYNAG